MLLVIDVGNTNVVFALFEGEGLALEWRYETSLAGSRSALRKTITDNISGHSVSGAILSSVVPWVNPLLSAAVEQATGQHLKIIGEGGVAPAARVAIDKPGDVGHDRLVNADAAFALYGGPVIVVDFGTATTFDIIGPDGAYEGGVIAPGIQLSLKALSDAAAKLPELTVAPPASGRVTGRNTKDAMLSGIYWGYVGLIEGLIKRLRQENYVGARVIATGGLAPLFADATVLIEDVRGDLTLQGLRLIYERLANS